MAPLAQGHGKKATLSLGAILAEGLCRGTFLKNDTLAPILETAALLPTLIYLLVLFSAAATSRAASAPLSILPNAAEIPSSLFGMSLISGTAWPQIPVGALGKGTGVNWPYVEPRKGTYQWDHLDGWVRLAEQHRVDFFYSNDLIPPWAAADAKTCRATYPGSLVTGCTSTVADLQDWDDFVTALATRYRGRMIYELWNEPYTRAFTGTVADMVSLTTREYRIIRAVDPGALILAPSGTSSYMDRYFASGGPIGVDVITFHSYQSSAEAVVKDAAAMKSVAAKYGLSTKPIWDTEGSWGSARLTVDRQTCFLASVYLLLWSRGVSRFYWYAWDSPTFGSLQRPSPGLSPAAIAYEQIFRWMVGARMEAPCSMASDSTWTCSFTRPDGHHALAVWNSATSRAYASPSGYHIYFDLAGSRHTASGQTMIGEQPLLFVQTR